MKYVAQIFFKELGILYYRQGVPAITIGQHPLFVPAGTER